MISPTSHLKNFSTANLGKHVPGELIVRTRPHQEGPSLVDDFSATVLHEFDTPPTGAAGAGGEFLHLKLPAGTTTEQALNSLAEDPRVEYAVPNHIYDSPEAIDHDVVESPNDLNRKLYGLHNTGQTGGKPDADIDAPEAWQIHTGRTQAEGGPLIAIIDTGIDYHHEDLKDNLWTNPGEIPGDGIDNDGNGVVDDVYGYNAVDDNGDPMDSGSHGTHVAGTIGARGDNGIGVTGVNQKANLMAVKIFGENGATASGIIRGIQYASRMGARVANNSWGGGSYNEGIKEAFAESPTLHMLSAGNNGKNNDTYDRYPGDYNLPNFIRVAATDHNDDLASYSNWAPTTVELGAPGTQVYSTIPGDRYGSKSGTSMATPHVTGAAALLLSHEPGLSNEEVKEKILSGGDPVPSLEGKTISGVRLNLHNSLTG